MLSIVSDLILGNILNNIKVEANSDYSIDMLSGQVTSQIWLKSNVIISADTSQFV